MRLEPMNFNYIHISGNSRNSQFTVKKALRHFTRYVCYQLIITNYDAPFNMRLFTGKIHELQLIEVENVISGNMTYLMIFCRITNEVKDFA